MAKHHVASEAVLERQEPSSAMIAVSRMLGRSSCQWTEFRQPPG
jgi:hypothetical protein